MNVQRRGRRQDAAHSPIPQLPWSQPRLTVEPTRIVSDDQLEMIHLQSLRVLEEIGMDVVNFSIGMKHAVREDPDVMLVGEMRDRETFETAIHAAETGHLVFGTIHASTAVLVRGIPADRFSYPVSVTSTSSSIRTP